MKRKVVVSVIICILIFTQFMGVQIVLSEGYSEKELKEQRMSNSVDTIEDSITNDFFNVTDVLLDKGVSIKEGLLSETSNVDGTSANEDIVNSSSSSEIEIKDEIMEEIINESEESVSTITGSDESVEEILPSKMELKIISNKVINRYATINTNNFILWEDLTFKKEKERSEEYFQQTLFVEEEFTFSDGLKFVSIKNNEDQILGYVNPEILVYSADRGGMFIAESHFVTITSDNMNIWGNLNLTETIGNSHDFFQQTLEVKGKYHHFDGSVYYSLYSNQAEWIGYINESGVQNATGEQGIYHKYEKYVAIKDGYSIWDGFKWETSIASSNYQNKTLKVKGIYHHFNGSSYVSLYNNSNEWIGYIHLNAIVIMPNEEGIAYPYYKDVVIDGTYDFWDGFDWKKSSSSDKYRGQKFQARYVYYHFSGNNYLSIYDNSGTWLGYLNENGVTNYSEEQGQPYEYNRYVSISGAYDFWSDFEWTKNYSSKEYKDQTLSAKIIYHHSNGSNYLSLYDNQNNWVGYMNELGTVTAYGPQGSPQEYGKYVTIKGSYNIWNGFDWKSSQSGEKFKKQTLEAREVYSHFDGGRYVSLYNYSGVLVGYINEFGISIMSGEQGEYHNYDKYVSIKGTHDIWGDFTWSNNIHSSKYKSQTLHARGIYYHFDGFNYLSLYDNKGKWIGYMDENGANVTPGKQGSYQKYGKYVTVKSNSEPVYKNFDWVVQSTGNIGKETYQAKGAYNHFDGVRYFSIYDLNNQWIGYISEKSIDEKPTHLFVMGHGSYDPGAVANGTSEREFTRNELLPYLKKYAKKLKNSEIVFYDTSKNMYIDSKNEQGLHNIHMGLSSVTELHLDAAGSGATGGHVIVHPNKKSYEEDLKLADIVKKYNGLWAGVSKNKGLSYRKDLLNLNVSHDYGVSYRLVELGFITNYQDLVSLRINLDRIAKEFIEVVTSEKL